MPQEIRMPALGQTTDELRIVRWLKSEGDSIAIGDLLLEVETDKAVLEIEAVVAGTLVKVLHCADEIVSSGELLAYIGRAGEPPPEPGFKTPSLAASPTKAEPTIPRPQGARTPRREPLPVHGAPGPAGNGGLIEALPKVRLLAKDYGIDLAVVRGTGPAGRIEKQDVMAAAAQTAGPVPQITLTMTADMRAAVAFVEAHRAAGFDGIDIIHPVLCAVAQALREHPEINRVSHGIGHMYRSLARADLFLAVDCTDSRQHIYIPEPDRLPLLELIRYTGAAAARTGGEMKPSAGQPRAAITVGWLDSSGVDSYTAALEHNQAARLSAGAVMNQAAVVDGEICIVPQMKLSLTIDQRIVTGVAAARFLRKVCMRLAKLDMPE